jgi:hypothetical protein
MTERPDFLLRRIEASIGAGSPGAAGADRVLWFIYSTPNPSHLLPDTFRLDPTS